MNESPPPTPPAPASWLEFRSMLRALMDLLMDFSFKRFVTPHLIRLLYVLSLGAAVLAALTWMFSGFGQGPLHGLFTLVTGPLAFLLYVISARVVMEVILAVIQIAERVREK
jgi:hypothetical protein